MNAWHPSLNSRWFVVAETRRLKRKPLAVMLLDRPLVVARLQSGELTVLDDRCPHRHFPLSAGRVVPEGLQCGYHGWSFGADGRCTAMPGRVSQEGRPEARVRRIDAIEHDGLVWARLESPGTGEPAGLPRFVADMPAGSLRFLWSTTWNGSALDALENFLDPLHTHMTHPGLVRRDGARRPVDATLRRTAEGITVDYAGQAGQEGLLFRLFEAPRVLERAHWAAAAAGTARIEYRYRNGSALHFTLHFTPGSAWQTRVHATLHVENRWAPAWAVRAFVWPFLRRVAKQDQRAVELQAANRQRFGPRIEQSPGLSTELDLVRSHLDEVWSPRPVPASTPDRPDTVRMLL